jgi:protein-disulfide isomerase
MLSRVLLASLVILAALSVESRAEMNGEKVLGDPNAKVTIIEFASLSCPHCAEFHKTRFAWLKTNFIDTGEVKFIFRDFPLNRPALLGSMVAHCAKPTKYFAYLSLLFERQEYWAFSEPVETQLAKLAQVSGMGQERLTACLQDEKLAEQIIKSRLDSQNVYNIESTPSFLVGDELIVGVPSEDRLRELIKAAAQ